MTLEVYDFYEAVWTSEVGEHMTHEKKNEKARNSTTLFFLNRAAKLCNQMW